MSNNISRWIPLALLFGTLIGGCKTVPEEAHSVFKEDLRRAGYEPYLPPRDGVGVGTVITFDKAGREVVVAERETCFPSLIVPGAKETAILSNSSERAYSGGFGVSAAQLTKDVADLSFSLQADSNIKVELKFIKPFVQYTERVKLEELIMNMKRSHPCYKDVFDNKNLIVVHVLGAEGVQYSFKDTSNKALKLNAEIMGKAKISPDLQRKVSGMSELSIDKKMLLGYRPLESRLLDAAVNDTKILRELDVKDVQIYREKAMR